MIDNPYAAPENSTPPPAEPPTQAAIAIRLVSRVFRMLGWPLFLFFLTLTTLLFCMFAYEGAKWLSGGSFMPHTPRGREPVPILALTLNTMFVILFGALFGSDEG